MSVSYMLWNEERSPCLDRIIKMEEPPEDPWKATDRAAKDVEQERKESLSDSSTIERPAGPSNEDYAAKIAELDKVIEASVNEYNSRSSTREEKEEFLRKRNALYSQRKYYRKKLKVDNLIAERDSLEQKNAALRTENGVLEKTLTWATHQVQLQELKSVLVPQASGLSQRQHLMDLLHGNPTRSLSGAFPLASTVPAQPQGYSASVAAALGIAPGRLAGSQTLGPSTEGQAQFNSMLQQLPGNQPVIPGRSDGISGHPILGGFNRVGLPTSASAADDLVLQQLLKQQSTSYMPGQVGAAQLGEGFFSLSQAEKLALLAQQQRDPAFASPMAAPNPFLGRQDSTGSDPRLSAAQGATNERKELLELALLQQQRRAQQNEAQRLPPEVLRLLESQKQPARLNLTSALAADVQQEQHAASLLQNQGHPVVASLPQDQGISAAAALLQQQASTAANPERWAARPPQASVDYADLPLVQRALAAHRELRAQVATSTTKKRPPDDSSAP